MLLIGVGVLLGQSGPIAPSPILSLGPHESLSQFIPKAEDLYYEFFEVPFGQALDVLTVPAGRVFVLTHNARESGLLVLRNGEDLRLTSINRINPWVSVSGGLRQQFPIQFPFVEGDVLSLESTLPPDPFTQQMSLWGYWCDASP